MLPTRYALIGGNVLLNGARSVRTDVLIEETIIKKFGDFSSERRQYDLSGCLVCPGLVNAHAHFGETIFRDLVRFRTLDEYIRQTEHVNGLLSGLGQQDYAHRVSSDQTALELIRAGTTTACAGRCVSACEPAGMRSVSAYIFMNSKKLAHFISDFERHFVEYLRFLVQSKLSKPAAFLHSLKFCDVGTLELCKVAVGKYHLPFTAHVLETEAEDHEVKKAHGKSTLQVLDQYGLIGPNSLLVHCCYASDEDIALIEERKATVVICPTSNLRLGNKLPPLPKFVAEGINVSIGTDGLVTNPSPSLVEECLVARRLWPELSDFDFFSCITNNPARALGLDVGSLKVGSPADLIVYSSRDKLSAKGSPNLKLLDVLSTANLRIAIVNGNAIMENGHVLTLNEHEVNTRFEGIRNHIKTALGVSPE